MVEIPTSRTMGRTPAASGRIAPSGPSVSVGSGLRILGRGMQDAGSTLDKIEIERLEEEATAQAKERDTMIADRLRGLLYDPEKGFTGLGGKDAMARQKATLEEIEQLKTTAGQDLSEAARLKLEASITRRVEVAKDTVARHTMGQRDVYIKSVSLGRQLGAYNDALVDPSQTESSLAIIKGEVETRALREGLSVEETEELMAIEESKLLTAQIDRVATVNPEQAMELKLRYEEDGRLVPSDRDRLERDLVPEIEAAIGRDLGKRVAGAMSSPDGYDTVAYREAIHAVESQKDGYNAIGEVIKNPHSMYYGDRAYGRYQMMGRNIKEWSKAALGREVSIDEFMASEEIQDQIFDHRFGILLRKHGNPQDAASAWFTGQPLAVGKDRNDGNINGKQYVDKFNAALGIESKYTMADIIEEPNPDVRRHALSEFALRTGEKSNQMKQAQGKAETYMLGQILQGGSMDDVPFDVKMLGGREAVSALMSLEKNLKAGVPRTTDQKEYYKLKRMALEDPATFRDFNLMTKVDVLSEEDWQEMVKLQTKPPTASTARAASHLMSVAGNILESAGFKDDEEVVAELQTALLTWQEEFKEKNADYPTDNQINAEVGSMLAKVTIDPPGMGNKQSNVPAFNVQNLKVQTEVGPFTLPSGVVYELINALEAAGEEVNYDNIAKQFREALAGAKQVIPDTFRLPTNEAIINPRPRTEDFKIEDFVLPKNQGNTE